MMYAVLSFTILLATIMPSTKGALFRPEAYTLDGVEAVNGSSENGNCPTNCVTMISGIRTCFCGFGFEDQIDGALINGIPSTIIDTTQRDDQGNFVWASQLFTVRRNTGSTGVGNVTINLRFSNHFTLREVELYMFNCPTLEIGAQTITLIDAGGSFPSTLTSLVVELARITVTGSRDCTSLTRVSIPIQNPQNERIYAIDFTTPYEWVHIGEVRFSDQLITTTPPPTTQPTTIQPLLTTQPSTTSAPSTTSEAIMNDTTAFDETLMNLTTTDASTAQPVTQKPFVTSSSSASEQSIEDTDSENRTPSTSTTQLPSAQTTILSAIVATLLMFLVLGGIIFTVITICLVKQAKRAEESPTSHDAFIEMNANEAYGPVSGGRQLEENSEQEPDYEVIRD